ncbi:hypothetical protein SAMN05421642_12542 [Rhodococcoides kyotonense]|uniref:HTH-like domain-containing protein n=1 Tax=Rhodococcoides kyotonense TaxID=398843 RepID=A0A239N0T9_9NOCA|nr:hypothetical protein SAMN05421642_12542 [Rhodococcus kyotonensis]
MAREIHADDPAFGYRFIADELPDRGIAACENRVARLCSQERLWSVFWSTRDQLRLAIVTWIERTYHRKRRQRRLGKLTPVEFETINRSAHAA